MASSWTRRGGDPLTIGICAGVVLLAHGIALTLADAKPPRRLPGAASVASSDLKTVLVHLLPTVGAAPPHRAEPLPSSATADDSAARALVAQAAMPTTASAEGAVEVAERFYRFSEVDAPAEPTSEWNVALDALDAAGLERVAFDVWIDDRGRILACALLGAEAIEPAVRASLEAQLMATELRPAIRGGARVASHRRVEIFVDATDTGRNGR